MRRVRSVASIVLWAGVLACVGWAAVRTFGLERGSPGVPLIAYTPYAGLLALFLLVAALTLRRWGAAALALVAVLALAIAVVPRVVPDASPAAGGPRLTVMSANLRLGQADATAITELVERNNVDALSVQELTPAAVGRLREAGLEELLPSRVLSVGAESSGAGIYARHPLRRLQTVSVGSGRITLPQARLQVPGGAAVDLIAVHSAPPTGSAQVARWRQGLRSLPLVELRTPPRILIGDFNATLDHAELRRLLDSGFTDAADAAGKGLVPTWSSAHFFLPPLTIDHVLVDPRLRVHGVAAEDLVNSDHRVLIAELSVEASARATTEPAN
jgi:endonuclease/exonuclease/phosphatase (EEP) superfamily protein YafD